MILTQRQAAILHFIRSYVKQVGFPPSVQEITDGVKLRSKSSTVHHLRTLQDLGYLRRHDYIPRGLVVLRPEGDDV